MGGLLSFPPHMKPFELQDLNVLIGPNGSGKSNIIEALELLRSVPTDLASAIRGGGGAKEWIWKGDPAQEVAKIHVEIETGNLFRRHTRPTGSTILYRLEFVTTNSRVEVYDEGIEETEPDPGYADAYFYYRFQKGHPVINIRDTAGGGGATSPRRLQRQDMQPDQSVLAQFKDLDRFPELTWLGRQFGQMQLLRDWTFGRYTPQRKAQAADLPGDFLLPDCSNLALVLNEIEHSQMWSEFTRQFRRFYPGFDRFSTKVSGNTIQIYLHETGLNAPIPATRLSDGTIRFMALLATLLNPSPPPLICIDEPELGLHPDAVAVVTELIIGASERTQLIVATHSATLVSALSNQPDAVVTCEKPGIDTGLNRLDPESLKDWLNNYALGELWEMGELGANP